MYTFICPFSFVQPTAIHPCSKMNRYSSNYRPMLYSVKPKESFTTEEALMIANYLRIDFIKFDVEQFRIGLDVELEHGRRSSLTNITNDDPILTGKIALAHLNEFPDYYTRLTKMEEDAEKYWETDKD